jgi:methylase of polypeptide subunit release factors
LPDGGGRTDPICPAIAPDRDTPSPRRPRQIDRLQSLLVAPGTVLDAGTGAGQIAHSLNRGVQEEPAQQLTATATILSWVD